MSERLLDPEPTDWPADLEPWIRVLRQDSAVSRVYPAAGRYPVQWHEFRRWGPTASRFDHQPESATEHAALGIMYGAVQGVITDGKPYPAFVTALGEYYQRDREIAPMNTADWTAVILLARPVRLLDLGDTDWVTVAGGNAAIFAGERSQSRKWARAIHANYRVDGIIYSSSVNPAGRAVALWERAEDAMPSRADAFPLRTLVNEVENAADRIRYGVSWD